MLDGELQIEIEDADTITLAQHQGCTVAKGVVILVVEAAGVVPVGD